MQLNNYQGEKNPRGRPKGHGISYYLARIGDEIKEGETKSKKELVAIKIFEIVLNPETTTKDFITLASEIMDRLEGKPVNMNLNSDISSNPFEGIDTAKLEALVSKLKETKSGEVQGPNP